MEKIVEENSVSMDKTLRLYFNAALALKLPVNYFPEARTLQIKLAKQKYNFTRNHTFLNHAPLIYLLRSRPTALYILKRAGFQVPKFFLIDSHTFNQKTLYDLENTLSFPISIIPPYYYDDGGDCLSRITNVGMASSHLSDCLSRHEYMLAEPYFSHLKEFRIVLLKKQVIAIAERFPAFINADGHHSIQELIHLYNEKISEDCYASPIRIDQECILCLSDQNLTLNSIPSKGKEIRLYYSTHRSRGGRVCAYNPKINPDNLRMLSQAAHAIGLDFVGFDVQCESIFKPFRETTWLIKNVTSTPDILMHEFPDEGKSCQISKLVLKELIKRHPLSYWHSKFSVKNLCTHMKSGYTHG